MTPPKPLLAAALGCAALGCAPEAVTAAPPAHPQQPAPSSSQPPAPRPGGVPLASSALKGPYPTPIAACDAAAGLLGQTAVLCAVTPITLGPGAPFAAALLRARGKMDPRYASSGFFFLALGTDGAWFVAPKPLDQLNGAAGHMYLPVLTLVEAVTVAHDGGAHALFHLRDETSSVCNSCEGPERDKRTPVQTRALVLVCGRDRSGKPACSEPLDLDEKAKVKLTADGGLSITPPGGAVKMYHPLF